MKRLGVAALAAVLASGCTTAAQNTAASSTTAAPLPTVASVAPAAATTQATTTTTDQPPTTQQQTTTTLAAVPAELSLVEDLWGWEQIVASENPGEARYNGSYLAYTDEANGAVLVKLGSTVVLEHEVAEGWAVGDIELGEQWVGFVQLTEASPAESQVLVYDLTNGDVVFESDATADNDGAFDIPSISLSGSYMAIASAHPNPGCVELINLRSGYPFGEVCAVADVSQVELEGGSLAVETIDGNCHQAWSRSVYRGPLVSHANRECWSRQPAAGGELVVWFESPPGQVGIDTMIGVAGDNNPVGLGRGDNGTLEVCWGRAYWLSSDGDVRSWDGGGEITTIYKADDEFVVDLGCVGPWVSVSTTAGVHRSNMLSKTGDDACETVGRPTAGVDVELSAALDRYVRDRFDDLPSDLQVDAGAVLAADGWYIGFGSFSSQLESALFLWDPEGQVQLAWSGFDDSEYSIHDYMLRTNPDAPPALLGCIDVSGWVG